MIWIDLKHKKPTDNNLTGWVPWPEEKWAAWLEKSKQLVDELVSLNAQGKIEERNKFIDKHSEHWTELKEWLLVLSSGKCWFSEAKEVFSHYDVEHFRPKKEAKGLDPSQNRDGYWWLAFDYMNFRACGNVGNRKKGGWFPLKTESLCSSYASQCEESEAALLLDPIRKHDVDLVAFDEEGRVVPIPGASNWEVVRVEETVKRLKLNEHAPLADERRKIWQTISGLVHEYGRAKSRCGGYNPAAEAELEEICSRIYRMTDRKAELSAVAKWCVLYRNDPSLNKLLA